MISGLADAKRYVLLVCFTRQDNYCASMAYILAPDGVRFPLQPIFEPSEGEKVFVDMQTITVESVETKYAKQVEQGKDDESDDLSSEEDGGEDDLEKDEATATEEKDEDAAAIAVAPAPKAKARAKGKSVPAATPQKVVFSDS